MVQKTHGSAIGYKTLVKNAGQSEQIMKMKINMKTNPFPETWREKPISNIYKT